MKDRIKAIRNAFNLNQTEFGARIGVAQTTIAGYENGSRSVSDATIRSICREFCVNETWLRTGVGDMKAENSRAQEMAVAVKSLFAEQPPSFRSALVSTLLKFEPGGKEWALLEEIYESVAAEMKNPETDDEPASGLV